MSYSIDYITLSVIISSSCSCAAAGVKRFLGERKSYIGNYPTKIMKN